MFNGSVIEDVENNSPIMNGQTVHMIAASNPDEVDYAAFGIEDALEIDKTGVFTNHEAFSRHLNSIGVHKALLTAPGKDVPNIVYVIDHKDLDLDIEHIFLIPIPFRLDVAARN